MKINDIITEEQLDEFNMGSSSLRTAVQSINALVGMEFEMIVPNVSVDNDDGEQEPDYDNDTATYSIEGIADFFYDREYNDRNSIARLKDSMAEDYLEWVGKKVRQQWYADKDDYVEQWLRNNVDGDEWLVNARDETDEAIEEAFQALLRDTLATKTRYYDDALEEFRDETRDDWPEDDWLSDEGLDNMSDIPNHYDITWPYYHENESSGESIEAIANDFANAIGRKTVASNDYHRPGSTRQKPGDREPFYIVEPDGSLDADDSNEAGLEFVSPPLSITDMLGDLEKVKKWAKSVGAYTNKSTGLHINISVPGYSQDKLDFVKLALLLGDEYVLKQFDRTGNNYAKSAMQIVKNNVLQHPEEATKLLSKMKGAMGELASRAIHSGSTQKYTSINVKDGYVEFRSPGGVWLAGNFDKIENTLLRFVVALDAAIDPEKYKEEYFKKLYKMLAPKSSNDTISYFARFVAGQMPKAAMKSFVRQAQLERKNKKAGVTPDQQDWLDDPGINVVNRQAGNPEQQSAELATARQQAPEWTGWWRILDNRGNELHRINGIGNNQSDANRHAAAWLGRAGYQPGLEVEVVPEMR